MNLQTGHLKLLSLRNKKEKEWGKKSEESLRDYETPSNGPIHTLWIPDGEERKKGQRGYQQK